MSVFSVRGYLAREHALDFHNPVGNGDASIVEPKLIPIIGFRRIITSPLTNCIPYTRRRPTRSKKSLMVNQRRPLQPPC
jgi:hypothetical protein